MRKYALYGTLFRVHEAALSCTLIKVREYLYYGFFRVCEYALLKRSCLQCKRYVCSVECESIFLLNAHLECESMLCTERAVECEKILFIKRLYRT